MYLKAWDCEEEVLVTIRKRTSGSNGKMTICYKNVRMTGVENPLSALDEVLDISLDFMGLQAKRDLKIHRNEFREDFPWRSISFVICSYISIHHWSIQVSMI